AASPPPPAAPPPAPATPRGTPPAGRSATPSPPRECYVRGGPPASGGIVPGTYLSEARRSHAEEDGGGGEADLLGAGVLVVGGAVAGGAGDDGGEAPRGEAQDLVVLRGLDAFHGAGVDPHDGGGGHELPERQVELARGPVGDLLGRRLPQVREDPLAVAGQGLGRHPADLDDARHPAVDVLGRQHL